MNKIEYDIETSYFPDTFPVPDVKNDLTPEEQEIQEILINLTKHKNGMV